MITAAGPRPHGLEAARLPSIEFARDLAARVRFADDHPEIDLDPDLMAARGADFQICAILCFTAARNVKRTAKVRRDLVGEGAQFVLIAKEFHRAVNLF